MKHLKTFENFVKEELNSSAPDSDLETQDIEDVQDTEETEKTEESEELDEGNPFVYAAGKAKAEGKDEFEFNGKKYPTTIKKDTGIKK